MSEQSKLCIEPDGSLSPMREAYVWWQPKDRTICLDGDFTAQELIDIANHMTRNQK
jgi:hypothetical protein